MHARTIQLMSVRADGLEVVGKDEENGRARGEGGKQDIGTGYGLINQAIPTDREHGVAISEKSRDDSKLNVDM